MSKDLDWSDVVADAERGRQAAEAHDARVGVFMAQHGAAGSPLPHWITRQPLGDDVADAAAALIVALGRFVDVAEPLLRASEHRTLEAARMIAVQLPEEER